MLAACRGAAEAASIDYARLVYSYLEKEVKLATPIPIGRLCELGQVARAGVYRWQQASSAAAAQDLGRRDEMPRLAVEFPDCGGRRVQRELKDRGWGVNPKRVRRLMR